MMHKMVTTRPRNTSTLLAISALTLLVIFVAGSNPAAQVTAQQTKEVVFGPILNYTHKSGWFSLAIPGNWKITDNSAEGEVIVSFIDPTENGVVVARAYRPSRGYTQTELGEMLKAFLSERLGKFDSFTMGELKSQRDGSFGLYFKYISVVNDAKYNMYGDAFIEQHNGLIGVITLIMPQDQYEAKQKAAYGMVNSFRVTGTGP
jgi:hypothetical protein